MTTDYPDWQTPQANADKIASTGVPLLTKATSTVTANNTNVPFGGTVQVANKVSITQPGYEISVTAKISASAPTLPILTVELIWHDSVSGTTVGHEKWNVPMGSTFNGSVHTGTGPTKGDQLTVNLTNNDSAQAATVTTIINQNSRVYLRDDWRTEAFNSPPNGVPPLHDQYGNQLGSLVTGSLSGGGSVTRLLALYAGRVTVTFGSTVSKQGTLQITQLDPAQLNGELALLEITQDNYTNVVSLSLPRAACTFTLTDTSGSSGNILQAFFIVDEFLA